MLLRTWACRLRDLWCLGYASMLLSSALTAQEPQPQKLSKQELQFFESKIRPVLNDRCYSCHSTQSNVAEGGLRLDSPQAMLRGGSGGPVLVAGDPKASFLIKALEYHDDDFAMPPEDAGGKLPEDQIRDFVKWVKMGAPDPRQEQAITTEGVNEDSKSWWAFQPLQSSPVPKAGDGWAWTDIDRFIAARQDQAGVQPLGDASPEVLLRRLYFDLIGLPPSPEKQKEFIAAMKSGKDRQQIIEQVVDELLASDQFGMHWGRHWLDVARYAESTGRDINLPYNNAWRYRDYVIDAFNRDVRFDKFLIEQIAGDQLPYSDEAERGKNLIATGFLAVGSKVINEANAKQFAVDQADEQIDAVFQATMGLTVACARCHDHKFDPISQSEYTGIAGIFLSTETFFGAGGGPNSRNGSKAYDLSSKAEFPIALEKMDKEEFKKLQDEIEKLRKEVRDAFPSVREVAKGAKTDSKPMVNQQQLRRTAIQISELERRLEAFDSNGNPKAQAMCVLDKPRTEPKSALSRERAVRYLATRRPAFAKIDDSPFFARGDIDMPGNKVSRSVPHLFGDQERFKIPNGTSGRLQLAHWIVSDNNPMTSRVAVNRVWHWMIGQGIVTSVDNFGTTGALPSHPELLDHLAIRFRENGWSVKQLVREIATSRVYQLSSIVHQPNQANETTDPENRLCWRAKSRRLQAEEIRDAILASTGMLNTKPQLATTMASMNLARADRLPGRRRQRGQVLADDVCRSIYLSLPRSSAPEVLELFDLPDAAAVQGAREATNVPSQSLYLLNNQTVATQAGAAVRELMKKYPGRPMDRFEERLEYVYAVTLCRKPTAEEERFARKLLLQSIGKEPGWVSVMRGMYATAEFRYLD